MATVNEVGKKIMAAAAFSARDRQRSSSAPAPAVGNDDGEEQHLNPFLDAVPSASSRVQFRCVLRFASRCSAFFRLCWLVMGLYPRWVLRIWAQEYGVVRAVGGGNRRCGGGGEQGQPVADHRCHSSRQALLQH